MIIASCPPTPSSDPSGRRLVARKLAHLKKKLDSFATAIGAESVDICLLQQYEVNLADYKRELVDIHNQILALDLDDKDELSVGHASIEDAIFQLSIKIRKQLQPSKDTSSHESQGVKLPKLDVPQFDGNILSWKTFWEQFYVSVHGKTSLSDAEKLVYLQHSLKDGSAKHVIEGLSRTGDCYKEAVECLQSRFDRPRLIHQTHVRMILEASPLTEGTGKELRRLHDVVQQHLRALKAMDLEPSGAFITSVVELKLHASTMFEWQKHSQEQTDVPHYQDLFQFINLRAQASEILPSDQNRRFMRGDHNPTKKSMAIPVSKHVLCSYL